jgi:hypothetical protein
MAFASDHGPIMAVCTNRSIGDKNAAAKMHDMATQLL